MKTKNGLIGILLYDIVVVIAFVTLAILVSRWWVALFGILFLMTPCISAKYFRICDNCGKHSSSAKTYNDAIDQALLEGWTRRPKANAEGSDKFEDFCPECSRKLGLK